MSNQEQEQIITPQQLDNTAELNSEDLETIAGGSLTTAISGKAIAMGTIAAGTVTTGVSTAIIASDLRKQNKILQRQNKILQSQ